MRDRHELNKTMPSPVNYSAAPNLVTALPRKQAVRLSILALLEMVASIWPCREENQVRSRQRGKKGPFPLGSEREKQFSCNNPKKNSKTFRVEMARPKMPSNAQTMQEVHPALAARIFRNHRLSMSRFYVMLNPETSHAISPFFLTPFQSCYQVSPAGCLSDKRAPYCAFMRAAAATCLSLGTVRALIPR